MRKFAILTLLVFTGHHWLGAQSPNYMALEFGAISMAASTRTDENIRQFESMELDEIMNSSSFTSSVNIISAAAKAEWFVHQTKLSISSGLRYSRMTASVSRASLNGIFFYKFRETENSSEYITLREITQESEYIGVPLELRYYPFRPRRFSFYFRTSVELNYRIDSEADVVLNDPAMEVHRDELNARFDPPGDFNSMLTIAAGLSIGRNGKPKVGMELAAPTIMLHAPDAITRPTAGAGMFFFVKLPFNTTDDH